MADLQRTLNSAATVAQRPGPVDYSGAVEGVGNAVATLTGMYEDKKGREAADQLEGRFTQLGREYFAAQHGGELDEPTEKFRELQSAKRSGYLSDTMIKIEAEKILKDAIANRPHQKDLFRKRAYEVLGFDPTGAQVAALYAAPGSGGRAMTAQEKQIAQAEHDSALTGTPVETILRLQAMASEADLRAKLVAHNATLGVATGQQVLDATLAETDAKVLGFLTNMLKDIKAGGIRSPELTTADLMVHKVAQKQAVRDRWAAAGYIPKPEELQQAMAAVDLMWSDVESLVETGAMENVLGSQANSLANAMTIQGLNVMGHEAMINKTLGQEGLRHYHLVLDRHSKPGALDLLKREDSRLAQYINSVDELAIATTRAWEQVFGVPSPEVKPGASTRTPHPDAVSHLADKEVYNSVPDPSVPDNMKQGRLNYVKEAAANGKTFKMLGAYAQQGARQGASEEETRWVTDTFNNEYDPLLERIAMDMAQAKGTPNEFKVVFRDGRMQQVYTDPRIAEGNFPGPRNILAEAQLSAMHSPADGRTSGDVARLQVFSRLLSNGWEQDIGVRSLTFAGDTLTKLDKLSNEIQTTRQDLEAAVKAYEEDPSDVNWERVRSVDPVFASRAEQGSTGGRSE